MSKHNTAVVAAFNANSFMSHDDLIADVASNRLTAADANAIADKRTKLEWGMDAEEYRVSRFERASRKATAGGNVHTKGMGHRSLGAKSHGKATVCVSGSGYGRYDAERLHSRTD